MKPPARAGAGSPSPPGRGGPRRRAWRHGESGASGGLRWGCGDSSRAAARLKGVGLAWRLCPPLPTHAVIPNASPLPTNAVIPNASPFLTHAVIPNASPLLTHSVIPNASPPPHTLSSRTRPRPHTLCHPEREPAPHTRCHPEREPAPTRSVIPNASPPPHTLSSRTRARRGRGGSPGCRRSLVGLWPPRDDMGLGRACRPLAFSG